MQPLISATELNHWRLSDSPPLILDASWHLPATQRHAKNEFLKAHIPNAYFLDLDILNDPHSALPNTLSQNPTQVSAVFKTLGIDTDRSIVFYDRSDLHTACRAYWLFRLWGFPIGSLFVLDGGFDHYDKQGFVTASGVSPIHDQALSISFQPRLYKSLAQMKSQLVDRTAQVIDLRHAVRFAGGPESRAGLRRGHIPGSFCFPFSAFFNKEHLFLPLEKIIRRISDIGVDVSSPIISTCGSGMTATILNFVLDCLPHSNHALYDGSWSEWGVDHCFPDEASLAERPIETCLFEDLMTQST